MDTQINYSEALNELEDILDQIENEKLDVDELLDKVKRAAGLIEVCKTKLQGVESEVDRILSKMK